MREAGASSRPWSPPSAPRVRLSAAPTAWKLVPRHLKARWTTTTTAVTSSCRSAAWPAPATPTTPTATASRRRRPRVPSPPPPATTGTPRTSSSAWSRQAPVGGWHGHEQVIDAAPLDAQVRRIEPAPTRLVAEAVVADLFPVARRGLVVVVDHSLQAVDIAQRAGGQQLAQGFERRLHVSRCA